MNKLKKNSIIYYIFHVLILYTCSCSSVICHNNASINFKTSKQDFGNIQYKKEVIFIFEFTNPGKTPLLVSDVKTSCGCSVPEWSKKPILPGKKGLIKINYDAGFPGVFHKTISVYYNGPDSPVELEIKGEVEYPEEK